MKRIISPVAADGRRRALLNDEGRMTNNERGGVFVIRHSSFLISPPPAVGGYGKFAPF
jgi:hypothetical protein